MPHNERTSALVGDRGSEYVIVTDRSEINEPNPRLQALVLMRRFGLSPTWASIVAPLVFKIGGVAP